MTELWSDERIKHAVFPHLREVSDERISWMETYMLHPMPVFALCERIRNEYEQRIAELDAKVERLQMPDAIRNTLDLALDMAYLSLCNDLARCEADVESATKISALIDDVETADHWLDSYRTEEPPRD